MPSAEAGRQETLDALRSALDETVEPRESVSSQQLAEHPDYRRAKARAFNILAARDISTADLRARLLQKEHPPEIVDTLIENMVASNLLDDDAYAKAFVRAQRERRALSRSALRRELGRRGLSEQVAARALEGVDDEFDTAYRTAYKKACSSRGLAPDTQLRRILGMLARRGFPQDICLRAAHQAMQDAE